MALGPRGASWFQVLVVAFQLRCFLGGSDTAYYRKMAGAVFLLSISPRNIFLTPNGADALCLCCTTISELLSRLGNLLPLTRDVSF